MLPSNKAHAFSADNGKLIEGIPVIESVIEVDVAPIKTIVSTDSVFVFKVF